MLKLQAHVSGVSGWESKWYVPALYGRLTLASLGKTQPHSGTSTPSSARHLHFVKTTYLDYQQET